MASRAAIAAAAVVAVLNIAPSQVAAAWWTAPVADELEVARRTGSLDTYWFAHKTDIARAPRVVRAAYELAIAKTGIDEDAASVWLTRTVDTFASWRIADASARDTPEAELAAEAAFRLVELRIRKGWQPHYEGSAASMRKQLQADRTKLFSLLSSLAAIASTYRSKRWTAIAHATAGAILDRQRTALARSRIDPPDVSRRLTIEMAKAQATLRDPKASPADQEWARKTLEKPLAICENAYHAWDDLRREYYAFLEPQMLERYARAWQIGRAQLIADPALRHASIRLAYWEAALGASQLAPAVERVSGLAYVPGMFVRLRPGALSTH